MARSSRREPLRLTRLCVILVAIGSTALALSGTKAPDLVQASYATAIAPFVLLTAVLYQKETRPLPGAVTYTVGVILWAAHMSQIIITGNLDADLVPGFPFYLIVISIVVYMGTDWWVKRNESIQRRG